MCAFDCRVWLELFTIWVWEPLSSTHLIRPFLMAMKKLSLTTKHRALGFQMDGRSCGFQSLNIAKLVVEHRGTVSDVPLVPMGAGFVNYVLSIAALLMLIVLCGSFKRAVMMWRAWPTFLALLSPPPSTQVEGALSTIQESV